MKIAIINDTHAGIRNSSNIFTDNAELFYSKLFFPYLKENGIKNIIHMGDYYDDRKAINIKTLNRNRNMFLDVLKADGITMDIIPGNHDTFYKNTNDLNSLKELLGRDLNEVNIHMEPTVNDYDGMSIAMLPWINKENYDESMEFVKTCKASWLVGHLEFNGFDLLRGVQSKGGMDHKLFNRFEKVLTGHFHTRSEKDNILYTGTQLEFFWSDAHDKKYFHVLDTDTRELTAVHNPHTLFEKIIYDDQNTDYAKMDLSHLDNKFVKVIVTNKGDLYSFDLFIDRVQNRNIHDLKITEDFSEFVGDNVNDEDVVVEDTGTLLDTYIQAVDTDLDKDRLKVLIRQLLIEAQSTEIS